MPFPDLPTPRPQLLLPFKYHSAHSFRSAIGASHFPIFSRAAK